MFEHIIPLLKKAEKIGIFTHLNPDGDAIGSAYALKLMLIGMGKKAEVFVEQAEDIKIKSLIKGMEESGMKTDECDLFVSVDCAYSNRLGKYKEIFLKHQNTIAIDHHYAHKEYASITVVKEMSSTCELLVDLCREMGEKISPDIANNLYVGIVSDTRNFMNSNISGDTFRKAAELIESGAVFEGISKKLFISKTREYYELLRTALDRIEYYQDGKIGLLHLTDDDYEQTGCNMDFSGEMVYILCGIEDVETGIYIHQKKNGNFYITIRTTGETNALDATYDLGGTGHSRAVKCSVYNMKYIDVVNKILKGFEQN